MRGIAIDRAADEVDHDVTFFMAAMYSAAPHNIIPTLNNSS
jgi:hypothetical protein